MLLLRALFLDGLVCLHVLGAALLFRRCSPAESPWLAFFVPTLALLAALNFLEHFLPLPQLGLLLPATLGGSLWVLCRAGRAWRGVKFPAILFVALFNFLLFLKCLSPDIPCYTEGAGNLTRVLNYCLGGTLPPIDSWLPPCDYGGYYSFQQYGAAILKRLFFVDLGTAYNLAFALLLAWTALAGAAVAHSIAQKRWIAIALALILLAAAPGCTIFLIFAGSAGFGIATNPDNLWANHVHNPFHWLMGHDAFHPSLKLLPPLYTLCYSQYHADLGGAFLSLLTLLAAHELFARARTDWPWITLLVIPMVTIITSAWFLLIVLFFGLGSLALALGAGRRPRRWRFVCVTIIIGWTLLWPSVYSLLGNSSGEVQSFFWTHPNGRTPLWMFLLQWWPIYLPWLCLCLAWRRLSLPARGCLIGVPAFYIFIEYVTLGDRGLMVEKLWGALFGAGLVTLVPLLLRETGLIPRLVSGLILATNLLCLGFWLKSIYYDPIDLQRFCYLQGDFDAQQDPQTRRLIQVLSRLHGATVLPGKAYWAYNYAPSIVTFSENRCYVAYSYQQGQAGYPEEASERARLDNSFYAGAMADPLPFLRVNGIAAIMIWPEDQTPDSLLQRWKEQLGPDYFYVDCRENGAHNAGLFMRQSAL